MTEQSDRAKKHYERLVETVARALAEASGYDPDQLMTDTRARFRRLAVAVLNAINASDIAWVAPIVPDLPLTLAEDRAYGKVRDAYCRAGVKDGEREAAIEAAHRPQ